MLIPRIPKIHKICHQAGRPEYNTRYAKKYAALQDKLWLLWLQSYDTH